MERQGLLEIRLTRDFSSTEFIDNLLTKGSYVACDETSKNFNQEELPPYYDEEMYKRGQDYFHKNIFGMLLGNLLGLLAGLALQPSLAILILTKMSSSDLTAYKRYLATIFHMMIWYDEDFRPGSKLWESIKDVKSKHDSASKKSAKMLGYRINQKDMALTQFGFMGLILTRNRFLGVYDVNEEELKCFVHVWRVIGYVLGIKDEFNICRESVDETRAICNEIISKVILPEVEKRHANTWEMCSYLTNGLKAFNPFLNLNAFMFYLEVSLKNSRSSISFANQDFKKLTFGEKFKIYVILIVIYLLRFSFIRNSLNRLERYALAEAKKGNFIARKKWGEQHAKVNIIGQH
ncbi:uncharacterized protein LOC126735471 isoform X2 [Anthonomus grandis grandis]|uniref:uncharacterized protein LOC126735471 isoform X2 n=1 Tax=Anthonomus grandis grandis TaxID=2921223 RepID=UPI0021655D38|nr:uncharacterized protein LOC126735471 isoform X2 [Anthonomus grandis grandis]